MNCHLQILGLCAFQPRDGACDVSLVKHHGHRAVLVLRKTGLKGGEGLQDLPEALHALWRLDDKHDDFCYLEVSGELVVAGGTGFSAKLQDLVPMGGSMRGDWPGESKAYLRLERGSLESEWRDARKNKHDHHQATWFMALEDGKPLGGFFRLTNVVRYALADATALKANGYTFTGTVSGFLVNLPAARDPMADANQAKHCEAFYALRKKDNTDKYFPWRTPKVSLAAADDDVDRESDPVYCPPAMF